MKHGDILVIREQMYVGTLTAWGRSLALVVIGVVCKVGYGCDTTTPSFHGGKQVVLHRYLQLAHYLEDLHLHSTHCVDLALPAKSALLQYNGVILPY